MSRPCKLTRDDVAAIRRRRPTETLGALAREFGVAVPTILRACRTSRFDGLPPPVLGQFGGQHCRPPAKPPRHCCDCGAELSPGARRRCRACDSADKVGRPFSPRLRGPSPEDVAAALAEREAALKPQEARAIRLRYGLNGGGVLRYREMQDILGFTTRQRAEQLVAAGLRKLLATKDVRKAP